MFEAPELDEHRDMSQTWLLYEQGIGSTSVWKRGFFFLLFQYCLVWGTCEYYGNTKYRGTTF